MDDLLLVQKCIMGDQQAWNELIDKYSRLIYSYIHRILSLYNTHLAQTYARDIFQEIFLSLSKNGCQKLRTFKGKNGCSLSGWLRQVTMNYSIDFLRRQKVSLSLDEENDNGVSLKDRLHSEDEDIRGMLDNDELKSRLLECMGELTMDDKYFLELHIHQDVSLEDLRRHLGISRGAVDMRKARIIERLRDCFTRKGFFVVRE